MEHINHPDHYGGDGVYEVFKVADAWGFWDDAYLFNVLKYIARAGKKSAETEIKDLEKALVYLSRKIQKLKESNETPNPFGKNTAFLDMLSNCSYKPNYGVDLHA